MSFFLVDDQGAWLSPKFASLTEPLQGSRPCPPKRKERMRPKVGAFFGGRVRGLAPLAARPARQLSIADFAANVYVKGDI